MRPLLRALSSVDVWFGFVASVGLLVVGGSVLTFLAGAFAAFAVITLASRFVREWAEGSRS